MGALVEMGTLVAFALFLNAYVRQHRWLVMLELIEHLCTANMGLQIGYGTMWHFLYENNHWRAVYDGKTLPHDLPVAITHGVQRAIMQYVVSN